MNKLHEALKNEELMLEVGRKATEEQKAMTQSTVEERLNELVRDFTKVTPISKSECRDKLNDLLQLAEQKAREEILNSNEYKQLVEDALKYNDLTK